MNSTTTEHSYFLSLELEGINCFKDKQILDLSNGNKQHQPWTIILGDNGTGKTTLLKALKVMQPDYSYDDNYRPLLLNYPQFLKNSCLVSLNFVNKIFNKTFNFLVNNLTNQKGAVPHAGNDSYPFLLSYGASRRMNKKSYLKYIETNDLKSSLFDETIELINVEEWFIEKFLKTKFSDEKIKKKVENQLEIVKNLLIEILPDVVAIDIKPLKEVNDKFKVEVKISSDWINLRDLSYGYQTITALIVDISANMMDKYYESDNPLKEPVIILIDEIDLHLHPKWQRTVIDKLSYFFPKAQFIVTAHSPLIVQASEGVNANIVVCRKEDDRVIIDNKPENVKGWRVDQILTSDLFEVESSRSKSAQEVMNEYLLLKGKDKLTERDNQKLKKLIPNIQNVFHDIPSDLDDKLKKFSEKYL